ncbi:MAG: hypothetical protein WAT71_12335 [Ignavibacteria bacterium]
MNLEEKIKSLTPYQVIDAMIQGLKNPSCRISMETYGKVRNKTCFGCAATNALQYLAGKKFTATNIKSGSDRAKFLEIDCELLDNFEHAIDYLRSGNIEKANDWLCHLGIDPIKYDENKSYPYLNTNDYLEKLHAYEELRDQQIKPT